MRLTGKICEADREIAEDCRKIPIETLRFSYSTNYFSGLRIQEK